jgi:hypothetical protein
LAASNRSGFFSSASALWRRGRSMGIASGQPIFSMAASASDPSLFLSWITMTRTWIPEHMSSSAKASMQALSMPSFAMFTWTARPREEALDDRFCLAIALAAARRTLSVSVVSFPPMSDRASSSLIPASSSRALVLADSSVPSSRFRQSLTFARRALASSSWPEPQAPGAMSPRTRTAIPHNFIAISFGLHTPAKLIY